MEYSDDSPSSPKLLTGVSTATVAALAHHNHPHTLLGSPASMAAAAAASAAASKQKSNSPGSPDRQHCSSTSEGIHMLAAVSLPVREKKSLFTTSSSSPFSLTAQVLVTAKYRTASLGFRNHVAYNNVASIGVIFGEWRACLSSILGRLFAVQAMNPLKRKTRPPANKVGAEREESRGVHKHNRSVLQENLSS